FSLALVKAEGVSTIKEKLYEDRFDYTVALQGMGANIHVFDPHTAVFYGPSELRGTDVEIPDLRAGATLVLAALAAEGRSCVTGIEHVTRGYEELVAKLSAVGARIEEASVEVGSAAGDKP
ncbi:MAG: UDP-N-acetylglucosamine 1-carboxyvinyltransferase, partial [Chloroflexi bacterium]|nr:UDP-N-acetylglucosamine 1-carboxyvinyltransferase [Chloroflexota bacterium]